MGRWIAIGKTDRWQNFDVLSADLKPTGGWRLDAQTSITEVVVLEDGRIVAECHTRDPEVFKEWLLKQGCAIESLTKISHLARTGEVWRV